ncbi:MAG: hypothetical protein ACJ8ER_17370 [Allosphingosinicella sp.]
MSVYVRPCEVRNELLIAIGLDVEDQDPFQLLHGPSIALGAQEDAQLERHVEARQPVGRVQLGAAEVVHAVATFGDDPEQFVEARLPAVVHLPGRARLKPAGEDREDQGAEHRRVFGIERTVYEDVVRRERDGHGRRLLLRVVDGRNGPPDFPQRNRRALGDGPHHEAPRGRAAAEHFRRRAAVIRSGAG